MSSSPRIQSWQRHACSTWARWGELANRVEDTIADAHPEIPWRYICGLRNRIVHDYEGVNLVLIWQIIRDDLPELVEKLDRIEG